MVKMFGVSQVPDVWGISQWRLPWRACETRLWPLLEMVRVWAGIWRSPMEFQQELLKGKPAKRWSVFSGLKAAGAAEYRVVVVSDMNLLLTLLLWSPYPGNGVRGLEMLENQGQMATLGSIVIKLSSLDGKDNILQFILHDPIQETTVYGCVFLPGQYASSISLVYLIHNLCIAILLTREQELCQNRTDNHHFFQISF